jgi:hypothetical protein
MVSSHCRHQIHLSKDELPSLRVAFVCHFDGHKAFGLLVESLVDDGLATTAELLLDDKPVLQTLERREQNLFLAVRNNV